MNKALRFVKEPVVAGSIALFITAGLIFGITYQRNLTQKEQRQIELFYAAETIKARINTAISEAHAAVNIISVSSKKTGGNNDFDTVASKILAITQSVDGLGLVEGETFTHFYPLQGNESVIGHNVFKDTLRNKELLKALQKKDLFFAGPYQLMQGGTGIVGRLPIYNEGKYFGFAIALIKLSTFLKAAGLDSNSDAHYQYQLSKVNINTGKEEYFLPNFDHFNPTDAFIEKIPDGDWTIHVALKKQYVLNLIFRSTIFGILISLLAGFFGWFLASQPKRLQKLLDQKIAIIRQGEEKYTALFQQALDSIIIVDKKGNFIEANNSFCNLVEYSRDELLQMNITTLVDIAELANNPLDYALQPHTDSTINESRLISKTGKKIDLEVSRKIVGENQVFGIARDITHLKQVQQQIALSEATLRGAFEHSAIGMAMISVDGIYLRTNIALSDMTGYSSEKFAGMNVAEITYSEDRNLDTLFYEQLKKGEIETFKMEKRYVCHNGSLIWINVNASAIRDVEGQPLFFITQIENITEKKLTELEIQKLNRLYHFISVANESLLRVDNQQELFAQSCKIAVDLGGVTMAWVGSIDDEDESVTAVSSYGHDDGYLDSTEMSTNENNVLGKGPTGMAIRTRKYSFCNDIANDPLMAPWRKEALKRLYYSSISYPILVSDKLKAVFTMYVSEANYFNEKEIQLLQKLVDNIAFTLDKIELKELRIKAKAELVESEEKFRTLVEQSMVGVYILQDEKFVYVNPGFEKISGYSMDELVGHMSFDDLIHETDIEIIRENNNSGERGEKATALYLLRLIHGSGEVKHIEIVLSTILFKNRPAIIGTAVDITSRMEEDRRIEQAIIDSQEKERLQIGMELHDNVKQILGASIMQLEILKHHLSDEPAAFAMIDTLKKYNIDAVNELRRLSHQLAPSLDADQTLAEKIASLAGNMNIANKLVIHIDVDTAAGSLNDKIQLAFYRIIQEQLNNILKYAIASQVTISVKLASQMIILSVTDDGLGFDTTIKKEGIGLENIRRRAGLLDGKAKIVSAPGKGCTVIVEIPHIQE
ncbi:MAG: PAS domain S-box protein [Ferruginibacter sp.]